MADVTETPVWWVKTKRGVGMAMMGLATLVPVLGVWMGVTLDAATIGQLGADIAAWFDLTWKIVGSGLWIVGSIFPTGTLTFFRPR